MKKTFWVETLDQACALMVAADSLDLGVTAKRMLDTSSDETRWQVVVTAKVPEVPIDS